MSFDTDEDNELLFLNGEEVQTEDGEVFDLLASSVTTLQLSELPLGFQAQLCDRVLGSFNDLFTREPSAIFENSEKRGLLVHLSTVFFLPSDNYPAEQAYEYLNASIQSGTQALDTLKKSGRLLNEEKHIYEDMAFLKYTIKIHDQTFKSAEEFITEIDHNVAKAHTAPSLFLCHASEDKPFVDKLVEELDKYALYAWYDKREIFVGDSIVEQVNSGLENSDILVAVLSPNSINKPWVVREMNSSLMRQLANKGITIFPIMIEACEAPALLQDIKYADFTNTFENGFQELLQAIQKTSSINTQVPEIA